MTPADMSNTSELIAALNVLERKSGDYPPSREERASIAATIRSAITALSTAQGEVETRWQTMESASLDGTEVLIAYGLDVTVACYEPRATPPYRSIDTYNLSTEREERHPDHWTRVPTPPQGGA